MASTQRRFILWLGRDVGYHPRGYYRLARSLAQRFPTEVWGQPLAPVYIEGPLQRYLDPCTWEVLTQPPQGVPAYTLTKPLPLPSGGILILTNPVAVFRAFLERKQPRIWDVWEDYPRNFRHDPVYSWAGRWLRRVGWAFLRWGVCGVERYWLAEYVYAPHFPLLRTRFFPNAFVPVEQAPPLLPDLVGTYALYTGNLTQSWGVYEAVEKAAQEPYRPFVIAGSLKNPKELHFIREKLRHHAAWLCIYGRFVPYPVIQNLQRHAQVLYAFYQPLPHLVGKIPGKFYEAAALGVPCAYRVGVSAAWDAFWRQYREEGPVPSLWWSYYEPMLWEEAAVLWERFYEGG
ncbi:MAG: hypothetical protein N3A68_01965 [Bacteroidia bacterium]|nr:hypothetical protein [Bacteroidia bacterium]GIV23300.1 MAG: hypothetical protein KatS3mg025_0959 [Bacteroidia bacterium]